MIVRRWIGYFRFLLSLRKMRIKGIVVSINEIALIVRTLKELFIAKEVILDNVYRYTDQWPVTDIGAGIGDFTILANASGFEQDIPTIVVGQANVHLNSAGYVHYGKIRSLKGITDQGLVKIDIEGEEFGLFSRSSNKAIRSNQAYAIEYHGAPQGLAVQELVMRLQSCGFLVELVPSKVHRNLGYIYAKSKEKP